MFRDLIFTVHDLLWDYFAAAVLIGTGIVCTIALKYLQFKKFKYALTSTFFSKEVHVHKAGSISPLKSLLISISSTVGTGNIAGVALAISVGGPGAIFWMWVTALIGMSTKYAEVFLSVYYRERSKSGKLVGGPMYVIKNGLGAKWLPLALVFVFFALLGTFGTAAMTHANAVAHVLEDTFFINRWVVGVIAAVLVAVVILGGLQRLADVSAWIVTPMVLGYLFFSAWILIINYEKIPAAFQTIFALAFTGTAATGGFFGTLIAGVSRGLYSNEAGQGSSGVAHAAADTDQPVRQGCIAMLDCFLDTIVICTMSGLVVIVTDTWQNPNLYGTSVISSSFSAIPFIGNYVVAICLPLFSFSTVLAWSYYGEVYARFFSENNYFITGYRMLYLASVYLGAVQDIKLVWTLSNIANALMMFPNIITILVLIPLLSTETKNFFTNPSAKEKSNH